MTGRFSPDDFKDFDELVVPDSFMAEAQPKAQVGSPPASIGAPKGAGIFRAEDFKDFDSLEVPDDFMPDLTFGQTAAGIAGDLLSASAKIPGKAAFVLDRLTDSPKGFFSDDKVPTEGAGLLMRNAEEAYGSKFSKSVIDFSNETAARFQGKGSPLNVIGIGDITERYKQVRDAGIHDADFGVGTLLAGAAQSLPEMFVTAGAAGLAGRATSGLALVSESQIFKTAGMEALANLGKVVGISSVTKAAIAGSPKAIRMLKYARLIPAGSGALVGGIAEGSLAGAASGMEAEDQILNTNHDDLLQHSERYLDIYASAEGMEEEQRREYARQTIAREAGTNIAIKVGLSTAALSSPSGFLFGHLASRAAGRSVAGRAAGNFFGKLEKSAAGRTVLGTVTEGIQEFFQEGAQAVLENIGVRDYVDRRKTDIYEGVLDRALMGGLIGGVLGGPVALVLGGGGKEGPDAAQAPDPTLPGAPPPDAPRRNPLLETRIEGLLRDAQGKSIPTRSLQILARWAGPTNNGGKTALEYARALDELVSTGNVPVDILESFGDQYSENGYLTEAAYNADSKAMDFTHELRVKVGTPEQAEAVLRVLDESNANPYMLDDGTLVVPAGSEDILHSLSDSLGKAGVTATVRTLNDTSVTFPQAGVDNETAAPENAALQAAEEKAPVAEEGQVAKGVPVTQGPAASVNQTDGSVVELPLDQLTLSGDIPQFKSGADASGVVEALGGKFDRRGTGPIQAWRRKDGRLEVISGRHRLDLARRSGEQTIPSQIYDEADGFSIEMAASLDAELNIRDGQGKVKDYVNFFQNPAFSGEAGREEAESRGLLGRATGRRAYTIASQGSPDLIAAHSADKLTDEAATQIAATAPGDARLQALGMKLVQEGKSIALTANTMRAVKVTMGDRDPGNLDLFGFDDSAVQEAIKMAGVAVRRQREIGERLAAITGASKRPELAAKEGVDVRNPKSMAARIAELRAEKIAWEEWATNPVLLKEIRSELGIEPEQDDEPEPDLFSDEGAPSPAAAPFALTQQTKSDEVSDDEAKRGVQSRQTSLFGAGETASALRQRSDARASNAPAASLGGGLFADQARAKAATDENLIIAAKLLLTYDSFGRIGSLAGDSRSASRQKVMSALLGKKVQKSQSGITAIENEFYARAGIKKDTSRNMKLAFAEWTKQATAKPSPKDRPDTTFLPTKEVAIYGETSPLSPVAKGGSVSEAGVSKPTDGAPPIRGQLDMFVVTRGQADPGKGHEGAVKVDKIKLLQLTKLVQTGQFRSGYARVTSLAEAAHILAPLRKSAQEQFLILALDADGKPLAVLRHSMGLQAESQVSIGTVFGAIATIPGVKSVVFGHNHPSGNIIASVADIDTDREFRDAFDGSGIDIMGAVIVSHGQKVATIYSRDLGAGQTTPIATAKRTLSIPRLERVLSKIQQIKGREQVLSPANAGRLVSKYEKNHPAAILLLNNSHRVVGIIPFDPKAAEKLRTGNLETSHAVFARAAATANAVTTLVYGPLTELKGVSNASSAMRAGGFGVVDVFFTGSRLSNGFAISSNAKGLHPEHGQLESVDGYDLTPKEQAAYNKFLADRADPGKAAADAKTLAARAELSRTQGAEDADFLGLRDAVTKAVGDSTVIYLRGLDGLPARMRDIAQGREARRGGRRTAGTFDKKTKTVYLFTDVTNTPFKAALVASHEIAGHLGIRNLFGADLDEALEMVLRNPTVADLAAKIYEERNYANEVRIGKKTADGARLESAEEALAELAAALRTNNWDSINNRYGVPVPEGMRAKIKGAIDNFLRRLKELFAAKGVTFKDADVRALLEAAWQAAQSDVETLSVILPDGSVLMDQVADDDSPLFSLNKSADTFYSAALRTVEEAKGAPKNADGIAWKQWLDGAMRRGDMKQSERDWLGIDAFLDRRETTTREELADFVRSNQVKVNDVTLGARYDEPNRAELGTPANFPFYQLLGGENYREVLLTLPEKGGMPDGFNVIEKPNNPAASRWIVTGPGPVSEKRYGSGPTQAAAEQSFIGYDHTGAFKSPHFDHPNIIAHIRLNERVDSNGKRVLFIEELQSDMHQAGRKRGYSSETKSAQKRQDELDDRLYNKYHTAGWRQKATDAEKAEWDSLSNIIRTGEEGVPDAPFKGTSEWATLAFKQMVRHAAENGFDSISWATGEQQADRYGLSKQVDSITINRHTEDGGGYQVSAHEDGQNVIPLQDAKTLSDLENIVGKELAKKASELGPTEEKTYSGLDLKVGGEGMKAFYDGILPAAINKWAKKFGGRVGESRIAVASMSDADFQQAARQERNPKVADVHSIDLTPSMRDAALGGLPLFSKTEGPIESKYPGARSINLLASDLSGNLPGAAVETQNPDGSPAVFYRSIPQGTAALQLPAPEPTLIGHLLSKDPGTASGLASGSTVEPVVLSMKSPAIMTEKDFAMLMKATPAVVLAKKVSLLAQGHDGIISGTEAVVFDKSGITSVLRSGSVDLATLKQGDNREARHTKTVAAVEKVASRLKKAAPFSVVRDESELPAHWGAQIKNLGMDGRVEGFYDPGSGQVFIISKNITPRAGETYEGAVERVFSEEMLGHFGLRATFGSKALDNLLDGVWESQKSSKKMRAIIAEYAEAYGDPYSDGEASRKMADEFLAKSDPKAEPGVWKKLVAWVREQFRRMGVVREWSDNDILHLMSRVFYSVRTGQTPSSIGKLSIALVSATGSQATITTKTSDGLTHIEQFGDTRTIHSESYSATVINGQYGTDPSVEVTEFSGDASALVTYLAPEGTRTIVAREGLLDEVPGTTRTTEKRVDVLTIGDKLVAKSERSAPPSFSLRDSEKASPEIEEILDRTIQRHTSEMSYAQRFKQWQREAFGGLAEDQAALSLKVGWIDSAAAIEALERGEFNGKLLDAAESAYKMIELTRNNAQVMGVVATHGVPVYRDGQFVIEPGRQGINDVFRLLWDTKTGKNQYRLWEGYAVAKRASRLITETNQDGTAREKLFTQQDIDTVMTLEKEYPHFKKVFDGWQALNNQALDLAVSRGAMSKETAELWRTNDYVPFFRVLEEEESAAGMKVTRGRISGQKVSSKRLTGSDARIQPVIENMVMNLAAIIDKTYKNEAMSRVVAMLDGIAMEKADIKWDAVKLSNKEIAEKLAKSGLLVVDGSEQAVREMTDAQKEMWNTFFRQTKPIGNDIVSVMVNGKPKYYRVSDPLVYRAIAGMTPTNFGAIMDVMGGAKHLLTRLVTLDPAFMMRNFMRDTLSAFVVTDGYLPLSTAIQDAKDIWAEDGLAAQLAIAGGSTGGFYNVTQDIRDVIKRTHPDVAGTLLSRPKQLYDVYRRLGQLSEQLNRVGIARAVIARGGSIAEAAWQAQDLTNFTRSGDAVVAKMLFQTVPFMNARIQGTYKLWKAATGKSDTMSRKQAVRGFFLRSLLIAIPSLLLALKNRDDPRFNQVPDDQKDTYWHIFVGDEHFTIPKPFEVGSFFATVPERLLRVVGGQDSTGDFTRSMTRVLGDVLSFNPTPQLLRPVVEQWSNKVFFTGNPIVGQALDGLEPVDQYSPWTSETARGIATIVEQVVPDAIKEHLLPDSVQSPARIEHLIRGYFGTIGMYLLSMSDAAVRATGAYPSAPAISGISDLPVFGSFIRGNPKDSRRIKQVDDLYRVMGEADAAFQSINALVTQGRGDAAEARLERRIGLLESRSLLHDAAGALRQINEAQRSILNADDMSPEEKRDALKGLTRDRNEMMSELAPMLRQLN